MTCCEGEAGSDVLAGEADHDTLHGHMPVVGHRRRQRRSTISTATSPPTTTNRVPVAINSSAAAATIFCSAKRTMIFSTAAPGRITRSTSAVATGRRPITSYRRRPTPAPSVLPHVPHARTMASLPVGSDRTRSLAAVCRFGRADLGLGATSPGRWTHRLPSRRRAGVCRLVRCEEWEL